MPFPLPLQLQHVSGENWVLLNDFKYEWPRGGLTLTVPKGYVTDQASIPALILPIIVNDTGNISRAAVPHDFTYTDLAGLWRKKDADLMFRDAMIEAGVPKWRAFIAWAGVKMNLPALYRWNRD